MISLCVLLILFSTGKANSNVADVQQNSSADGPCKLIETQLGKISGIALKTVPEKHKHHIDFCGYRGIPFAKPPIGELRFKAPVPVEPWHGTLNATSYSPNCKQTGLSDSNENCLYLNVFIPNAKSCESPNEKIPVLVYFYGGAFLNGRSDDFYYGPELLLNKCVILVTNNYRVGAFGFLTLGTSEYSGNMGMKDQKMVIKWVKDNIDAFGGDSNKITIFGQSAGAISVLLHGLNTESQKNFKQIFAMSGPVKNNTFKIEDDNKNVMPDLAKKLGVEIHNRADLIQFIQNVSSDDVLEFTSPSSDDFGITIDPKWGPIIEKEGDKEAFIVQDPLDMYQDGTNTIPILISHLTLEYIAFMIPYIQDPSKASYLNDNFTITLPYRNINQESCAKEIRPVLDKLRSFYFGNDEIGTNATLRQFVRMLSDMNFNYPIQNTMSIITANSQAPIRHLIINPRTPMNVVAKDVPEVGPLGGTSHGEDIWYLFYATALETMFENLQNYRNIYQIWNEADYTSQVMIEMLVNYATTGMPSSKTGLLEEFPVVDATDGSQTFVEISNTGIPVIGKNYNQPAFEFWAWVDKVMQQIKEHPCNC